MANERMVKLQTRVNAVRAECEPEVDPITMRELVAVVGAVAVMEEKLAAVFGNDCRVIVLGNGVLLVDR